MLRALFAGLHTVVLVLNFSQVCIIPIEDVNGFVVADADTSAAAADGHYDGEGDGDGDDEIL